MEKESQGTGLLQFWELSLLRQWQRDKARPKRPKANNLLIKTVMLEQILQPTAVETSFKLPFVSPLDPRIHPIGTSPLEEKDYAEYDWEVSMSVFDQENQI